MSYKIHYGDNSNFQSIKKVNISTLVKVLVCILCVILVTVIFKDQIVGWLIPGDDVITKAAFGKFESALESGDSFGDAFGVFCREIICFETNS